MKVEFKDARAGERMTLEVSTQPDGVCLTVFADGYVDSAFILNPSDFGDLAAAIFNCSPKAETKNDPH